MIIGCLKSLGLEDSEVHVLIAGDDRLQRLNDRYLGRNRPTDVLSFPDGDLLPSGRVLQGEVVISLDAARRQAEELGHDELREVSELALHGVLHLVGYDHERDHGEMDDIELQLREELLP
ncbi:MAG: rRNA maturation RNase YbeY [Acidobacteria bacterium]|nr:rRNA maturation RNase YbeY [Candidatus Sulfomarinibacter sp. MAG AM2]